MKVFYDNLWKHFESINPSERDWNPKEIAIQYAELYGNLAKHPVNVTYHNKEDLLFGNSLLAIYVKLMEGFKEYKTSIDFAWKADDIGTFLVELLHKRELVIRTYGFRCDFLNLAPENVRQPFRQLHNLFTIEGQNISLPDITYLNSTETSKS